MKYACYGRPNGPLVTPEEFIERATPLHKENGVFPFCRSCGKIVHVYGVHSPKAESRFDHENLAPDADPLDDCPLANRTQRFKGMGPDGWDEPRGRQLRAKLFEESNLCTAYGFCLNMCRKGSLNALAFKALIQRADKKNIWDYADIPLWTIPYILLTLDNFSAKKPDGQIQYGFHFIFDKPHGTTASALWTLSHKCKLKRVFSNSGNPVKTSDNPYPVSKESMIEKAGDTSWIMGPLLQALKRSE